VIQGIPLPLAVVDSEFRIRETNQAFCTLARLENGDLDRLFLPTLAGTLWGLDPQLRESLETLRNTRTVGESFEFEHMTPGANARTFCVRGCLLQPDGEQYLLVTVEDMTLHKEAERVLKVEQEHLASEVAVTTQALGRSQDELRTLTISLFTSQEDERRRIARECTMM